MIPFSKPYHIRKEISYIKAALKSRKISGNGYYSKKCHAYLEKETNCKKALLTQSCTAALEMAAILADIQPGDEVIMPSFTFVSTANAFVLRGAVPVFVDIRPDTLNIDETKIERAITKKTRAIVPVHYAGVACEMDAIMAIGKKYNLFVIEDAAQCVGAYYRDKPLGAIADFGCFSFHETKNITSGEGGALLINNEKFIERAEIIWEKGTDRARFFRGEIDKYTWVDIGSSYLPSEITAAFLLAQLEKSRNINEKRLKLWNYYYENLIDYERRGYFNLPVLLKDCRHNAHIFYIVLKEPAKSLELMNFFKKNGVSAHSHYMPLHLSKAGQKYGKVNDKLSITEDIYERIVRLPLYASMTKSESKKVLSLLRNFYIKD
ncbi:MAG: dTDP-4-amino-4,6-dideoxygalactose transaminase [Spirochaetia bacterium]|nr:dTDP-4-amino-4,6-dideoxygalactose transaminase [Spirochaetia bacterium]